MKLFVVAGVGSNDLEIPLVIFTDKQKAEDFVDSFPKDESQPSWLSEDFSEGIEPYVDSDSCEPTPLGESLYGKLFKNGYYYSGCGGCYMLRILEVEEGKPMVGWDLD